MENCFTPNWGKVSVPAGYKAPVVNRQPELLLFTKDYSLYRPNDIATCFRVSLWPTVG